jgi:hypothetical protein
VRAINGRRRAGVRSDGKTLLSVTYLDGADLSSRERWEGIGLTEAETADMRERTSDTCDTRPRTSRTRSSEKTESLQTAPTGMTNE